LTVKQLKLVPSLLAVTLLLTALSARVAADNWPQWRGPHNDGISAEKNIPAEWSDTKNLAWKLPLPGISSSTPAVWGDHIFLTCADGSDLVFICVSTEGKQLWKQKFGSGESKKKPDEGANNASPSPSTDGKHVWAFAGSGDFACFDFGGKEVWRFNAQDRYGKFHYGYGMHTTPVLYKDRLYIQLLHDGGQWVIALDKATGQDAWKIQRPSDGRAECLHSYASAFVWEKGDDAYLVVHGNDYTTGHSLKDGSELWRLGDLNPPTSKQRYNTTLRFVASPLTTPDLIVVPTAKKGTVVGLKPEAKGLVHAGSEYEQWRLPQGTPDVPSPLLHDGLVYLCAESGELTVLDAKTGQVAGSNKQIHKSRYRASPIYADGKVYLTARDGTVTVVKAGRKFEELATNHLKEDITASPAVSNGRIYLHGWSNLYAIEQK
jgi:outer membrane protein assembly factor BamB